MSAVSTDSLGAVLESVLSPEAAPDLLAFGGMSMAERNMADPAQLIDRLIKESRFETIELDRIPFEGTTTKEAERCLIRINTPHNAQGT